MILACGACGGVFETLILPALIAGTVPVLVLGGGWCRACKNKLYRWLYGG